MALIFDRFPSRAQAYRFAGFVEGRFERNAVVFDTAAEAYEHDPFPFELTAPVVHVERIDNTDERPIEESVAAFGGTFAGT